MTPQEELDALEALKEHPGFHALRNIAYQRYDDAVTRSLSEPVPFQHGQASGQALELCHLFGHQNNPDARTEIDARIDTLKKIVDKQVKGNNDPARSIRKT